MYSFIYSELLKAFNFGYIFVKRAQTMIGVGYDVNKEKQKIILYLKIIN